MRELSIEEMQAVSGGIDLNQITIEGRGEASRSDSAGGGGNEARFGKKIGQGTYQNGDIITRINRDTRTGELTYNVYNKNTLIYTERDERTLLQKLTAEFGPRFGTQPIRRESHN